MNESFNAILNAGKGPKWCDFRNRPGHYLTGSVALFDSGPGINFGAFDRKSDFLFLLIDTEYLNFDFLADLEYFTGMIDTAPGELADVNQSICASQVNKGTEVGKVAHHASADFPWFQLIEQFFTSSLSPFLCRKSL